MSENDKRVNTAMMKMKAMYTTLYSKPENDKDIVAGTMLNDIFSVLNAYQNQEEPVELEAN